MPEKPGDYVPTDADMPDYEFPLLCISAEPLRLKRAARDPGDLEETPVVPP